MALIIEIAKRLRMVAITMLKRLFGMRGESPAARLLKSG